MITVDRDHRFNPEFPERYQWQMIDKISLRELAVDLSAGVENDLKTDDRLFAPGLRQALCRIATIAEVYQ